MSGVASQIGFNPRPSSLTGEHATALVLKPVAFQSAPVIADGRTRASLDASLDARFQSAPVIADGRTLQNVRHRPYSSRFNPRPSSLTGEP